MTFNHSFTNIDSYNSEMRKPMIDKVFFADKIDSTIIVDYGCADGSMIEFLHYLFPDWTFVGFDISGEMIEKAKERCPFAKFFSNFDELQAYLNTLEGKKTVVCNSLIHEVVHYGSAEDVKTFWERIFTFDFVCIRDMMVSEKAVRQSDPLNVLKVKMRCDQRKLSEFEHNHGMIDQNWSFVHFLLKYRYTENWDREVLENYLPINLETFLKKIPFDYEPILFHHYNLPFIRRQIKKDFDIDLQDNTHIQLILEKK